MSCDFTCLSSSLWVPGAGGHCVVVMGIFPGPVLNMAQRYLWKAGRRDGRKEGGREGKVMPPNNANLGGPVLLADDLGALALQPRPRVSCLSFSSFTATLITHSNITGALKEEECLKGGGRGKEGGGWGTDLGASGGCVFVGLSWSPPPLPSTVQQSGQPPSSLLNIHGPWFW